MEYFDSDYMAGAHPDVLRRLTESNMEHTVGYGLDQYCRSAERMILERCGVEKGEVYFFEGGTQTNATVIQQLLRHNEGVLASESSHINVHEAGAIEATGHKVIVVAGENGKISGEAITKYMEAYNSDDTREHIVAPGMVYISFPTELGTLYTREELTGLREACDRYGLPLYIDGARLAYGLYASKDLELKDIAHLSDVFYIGGTKCGALFGEAMVTRRPDLFRGFRSLIKQRGGMLAKGRLLGIQFEELMSNGLYERIGEHGVEMAKMLKKGFTEKGIPLYMDSSTNQQFFVMPNDIIEKLKAEVSFEYWGSPGNEISAVRFVTDWSTMPESVQKTIDLIQTS